MDVTLLLAHLLNCQFFTETSYSFGNIISSSVKKVVSITIQQGEERIAIVSLLPTKKHHLFFLSPSGFRKCYTQAMQTTHQYSKHANGLYVFLQEITQGN